MNNNSSKQILLSVIGVAILVVAVVGVSFAFFTYTRTGEQNNLITTGSLVFTFADGSNTINLTNHFPISTADGIALTGKNNICTFSVTGKTTAGSSIGYEVFAVPGSAEAEKTRFKDTEVFVNIQSEVPEGMSFTPATGAAEGKAIDALTGATGKKSLGTGTVTATDSATTNFTVRMWVDSSKVTVGETGTYTTEAYGNLYYSMKILVEANA